MRWGDMARKNPCGRVFAEKGDGMWQSYVPPNQALALVSSLFSSEDFAIEANGPPCQRPYLTVAPIRTGRYFLARRKTKIGGGALNLWKEEEKGSFVATACGTTALESVTREAREAGSCVYYPSVTVANDAQDNSLSMSVHVNILVMINA
ncbi:hypothetical protein D5086_025081 [Populus alba]|uniref:Uncharacterized protein n=1 Tax=Populus alba TaxID=43335 RepID=A0ACC4B7A3_POPAL